MSYTPNEPFTVIIPARIGSTRLPNKAMADINGQPMIAHTIRRAFESGASAVIVATDDEHIFNVAVRLGVGAVMTSTSCNSGSDRIAEAIERLGIHPDTLIINLQGDEPCFPGHLLAELADNFASSGASMGTIAVSDLTTSQLTDPDVVKVVADSVENALYFSRAGIPFSRDGELIENPVMRPYFMRHVGVYAYRAGYLLDFVRWGMSPLEYTEKLEQLRVLWNGGWIKLLRLDSLASHGVDTHDDLERARHYLLSPR